MTRHSVNNNCTHGSCSISLFKFKSFHQFNTPKPPQILDIYSVVALQYLRYLSCGIRDLVKSDKARSFFVFIRLLFLFK